MNIFFQQRKLFLYRIMDHTIQVLKSDIRLNGQKKTKRLFGQKLLRRRYENRRSIFKNEISQKHPYYISI